MTSVLCASMILAVLGAFISLLISKAETGARIIGCLFGLASSVCSLVAGISMIVEPTTIVSFSTMFSFANFTLLLNPLAGLLVTVISILAIAAWIYGLSYFKEYEGRGQGRLCFFMNGFVISMIFVVLADNAFWFLVFFELMSLSSYFLVVFDQSKQSIKGGFMYFVMAHIGFMLIMISFLIMAYNAGSFEFADFRALGLDSGLASAVFILAFIGFGIKAGMVPFHSWLPQAHPAAPSNVSALMSGGMVKIGVFGIIKVTFDLLAGSGCMLWWGIVVIGIGSVSAVFGIAYAIGESDIKKVLAYCTVENVGIILIGVGASILGWAIGNPMITGLGLMAALFHLVNHAMFKGAMFLGAGSVLYRVQTRQINLMGGLGRVMPVTSIMFLIGAVCVCAIPPLNGFASEWFTYQSLIDMAFTADFVVKICGVIAAVALAVTGALAVVCFVKVYGVAFAGGHKSAQAAEAKEAPGLMVFANLILVILCIILGVCAVWIAPMIQDIALSATQTSTVLIQSGASIVDGASNGMMSLILLAVILFVICLIVAGFRGIKNGAAGKGVREEPWDCGYLPDETMMAKSNSFSSATEYFFNPLFKIRDRIVATKGSILNGFRRFVHGISVVEPWGDRFLVDGTIKLTKWVSSLAVKLQHGNFRVYVVYIVAILILFLIFAIA